jgi:hypothetical protein
MMNDEEKQNSESRSQKEREEKICRSGFSLIFWLLASDS